MDLEDAKIHNPEGLARLRRWLGLSEDEHEDTSFADWAAEEIASYQHWHEALKGGV